MSILASTIHRGPLARAQKAVIFGPEGIGKSTLAAQFPAPVFLDTEGGTHHLDVARLPAPKSWADVTAAVAALATEAHEFKTLVIDTADWLEKLLVDHVCKQREQDEHRGLRLRQRLRRARRGIHQVPRLARSAARGAGCTSCSSRTRRIVKFEQPDAAGAYDRYELKLSKQVGPLVKEWCDVLLFGNYFTKVAENDSGRKRGVGGRERKLYTTHTAAWDAKNRHGFDEMLPSSSRPSPRRSAATRTAPASPPAQPTAAQRRR